METFQPTSLAKSFNTVAIHAIGDPNHKKLQAYLSIVIPDRKKAGKMITVKNRQGKPVVATIEANTMIQLDHILRAYFGNSDVDVMIRSIELLDEFKGVPYAN